MTQTKKERMVPDLPRSGFVWHELMSRDPDESERFYREVVGISVRAIGGIAGPQPAEEGWPSGGPEGHWIGYLGSDDVDAAARKARELGGQVLLPPTDVPGVGRAAVLRDPDGAAFGVFGQALTP